MRDVSCFVGVEKQLHFFIVPLKWVISRKCGEKEKKKSELFHEQQSARIECVVGKATENTPKIRQATGFKVNVNLRESL